VALRNDGERGGVKRDVAKVGWVGYGTSLCPAWRAEGTVISGHQAADARTLRGKLVRRKHSKFQGSCRRRKGKLEFEVAGW